MATIPTTMPVVDTPLCQSMSNIWSFLYGCFHGDECGGFRLWFWLGIVGLAVFILGAFGFALYYWHRRPSGDEDIEEERQPILGLKRTPTYYQWNRPCPSPKRMAEQSKETWQRRRSALLKKYSPTDQDPHPVQN
ncbi:uncharacterized protein BYT42DRAFT_610203 [Radiomyces spectabilis]|uniref:uncharacterized protein n=1 Tax=Radiomyces spectabilis TaxID=64574 RepID=UPI00221E64AD|nr:uncharacterized protein BYT42DRAFT_610203 [Radiomyces spectabilis]KAI8390934.1 hypothetical protein BYT42DRAFT_610203 [Radiomyces spectabilis]